MDDNKLGQIVIPFDLIKNQNIYTITSYVDDNQSFNPIAIVINVTIATKQLRHDITAALLRHGEVELVLPIDDYYYLQISHHTLDYHTGQYYAWGKGYTN